MTVTSVETARAAWAGQAIVEGHAEMRDVIDHWAGVLAAAVDRGDPVRPARNLLHTFLTDEVLPHARAEERTLYRATRRADTRLLVRALISEHRDLAAMAAILAEPGTPAATAAQAKAISALFASHVAKEDSLLLPALEQSGADLAALVAREPRLAGQARQHHAR